MVQSQRKHFLHGQQRANDNLGVRCLKTLFCFSLLDEGAVNLSLITSKSLNTPEAVANTPTRDSRAKSVSIIEDDVLATSSRGKEGSYSPPASPLATSPNRGGPGSSFVVSKRPPLSTPILSKPRPQLYSKDSHKSSPNLLENQRTELEIENSPPVVRSIQGKESQREWRPTETEREDRNGRRVQRLRKTEKRHMERRVYA